MLMIAPDGMPAMVDPNSTFGLRAEGGLSHQRGVAREDNPYTKSHPSSDAEQNWFEGWDLYTKYLSERK